MRSTDLLNHSFKLMIDPVNASTNTLWANLSVTIALIVAKNYSPFLHFKGLFTERTGLSQTRETTLDL